MSYDTHGESTKCTAACRGDADEICGGDWALSVYGPTSQNGILNTAYAYAADSSTWTQLSPTPYQVMTAAGAGAVSSKIYIAGGAVANGATQTGSTSALLVYDIATDTYETSQYIGCYTDGDPRALDGAQYTDSDSMTNSLCYSLCQPDGYTYYGTQSSDQCFCGMSYDTHGESIKCTAACRGDANEICGGDWALSVYGPLPENMPSGARKYGGGVTVGSTIYVIGGAGPDGGSVATAEAFSVATSSWTVLAPMPETGHNVVAAQMDGTIYAGQIDQTIWAYDIATDAWSDPLLPSFPGTAVPPGAFGFTGSKLYWLGGSDPSTTDTATDEVYEIILRPLPTAAPTPTPTALPTLSPTSLPTPLPTSLPTPLPTLPPTPQPSALPTLLPSPLPSSLPTPLPSPAPTPLPTSLPSPLPTSLPTPLPTLLPSALPTPLPTPLPSSLPTPLPSALPTPLPTPLPSSLPTPLPSALPSSLPSSLPTTLPTPLPSSLPSSLPTLPPTSLPTPLPTSLPSSLPTPLPTPLPSALPTLLPSPLPSSLPTPLPSALPSALPTSLPSPLPSSLPTPLPTPLPTLLPSALPTSLPSPSPTALPSGAPTPLPTAVPSPAPSPDCAEGAFTCPPARHAKGT